MMDRWLPGLFWQMGSPRQRDALINPLLCGYRGWGELMTDQCQGMCKLTQEPVWCDAYFQCNALEGLCRSGLLRWRPKVKLSFFLFACVQGQIWFLVALTPTALNESTLQNGLWHWSPCCDMKTNDGIMKPPSNRLCVQSCFLLVSILSEKQKA